LDLFARVSSARNLDFVLEAFSEGYFEPRNSGADIVAEGGLVTVRGEADAANKEIACLSPP